MQAPKTRGRAAIIKWINSEFSALHRRRRLGAAAKRFGITYQYLCQILTWDEASGGYQREYFSRRMLQTLVRETGIPAKTLVLDAPLDPETETERGEQ